jgi:hypothetical protein
MSEISENSAYPLANPLSVAHRMGCDRVSLTFANDDMKRAMSDPDFTIFSISLDAAKRLSSKLQWAIDSAEQQNQLPTLFGEEET